MFSTPPKQAEAIVLARFRVNGSSAETRREPLEHIVPGVPENRVIIDNKYLGF
ncbi:MAG: hypothetical protein LBL05_08545 [Synergistaceae bacterium]|jgi:hypothetical protein|nr:hypothetical protein [Synergistaceae bacterium]